MRSTVGKRRMSRRGRLSMLGAVAGTAVVLAAPPAQAAAATVGLWHFDDAGSSAVDASGGGSTGSLHSVTTRATGAAGTSFSFAKTPAYVAIPHRATLNPDGQSFRVTVKVNFTVKPSAAVGDYTVVRKGLATATGGSWKIEITQDGRALCNYRRSESAKVQIVNGPRLNNGKWHTISCAKSGDKVTLTVDGTAWSVSRAIGSIANSAPILVGAKTTSGEDQYQGRIDELSITKG